jgi:methylated-DNA-[protein]-cysteine S-methyltransferase
VKKNIKTIEDVREYLSNWTEFEKSVLIMTFKIPEGKISTYKRIAEKVGKPKAYRAVANVLMKNPLHPIVPCHRVIRSNGGFGGPNERARTRMRLVEAEGVPVRNGRVQISSAILF